MKIIYLHQYFNTPEMRGGTRSYEMARRLVVAGHEVHVVTTWRLETEASSWFTTEVEGVNVHWLPVPYSKHMSFKQRLWAFVHFAVASARKVASLGGDVIFATSTPLTIAVPAVYARRKNRIPMVFEVRDLWPEMPIAIGALRNPALKSLAYWLERFAYRNSSHIVALSPGMKEGVVKIGYPESKVSVIPNSADLDFFYPGVVGGLEFRNALKNLGDRRLVVYTGAFGRVNGISYMVRMAKAAKDRNLSLYFLAVGDGQERLLVEQLSAELDVKGTWFDILPPVSKNKIPSILEAADVVCSFVINLPALWENSANKFFDGLASGTPVVINYEGWQADILRKNGAGLVLPANDPEAGAIMLNNFLMNRSAVISAGVAARQLAVSDFSRDMLANKLEEVLRNTSLNSAGIK